MNIEKPFFKIIKNFKTEEECEQLIKHYELHSQYRMTNNVYDRKIIIHYPSGDNIVDSLFKECSIERLKVLFPENDDYVLLFNKTFEERQYWCRFMHYINDMTFFPHRDAVGEIMCILYLTQPKKDYEGGLYIIKNNKIENVDESCNRGDLLIVDAHYFPHEVKIKQKDKGRLTFFVNFNPGSCEGIARYKTLEENLNV